MKKVVSTNAETINVASGFEQIGDSVKLNRDKLVATLVGINQANNYKAIERVNSVLSDGTITESEKTVLKRELESITRDYNVLVRESENIGLDYSTDEDYANFVNSYLNLYSTLSEIVDSVGDYTGEGITLLAQRYETYMLCSNILETKIANSQDGYNQTFVSIVISPELLPADSYATVRASVFYKGVEKTSNVSGSSFVWEVINLASGTTSSAFVLPTGATISIDGTTATIENTKTFQIHYDALPDEGVQIYVVATIDFDDLSEVTQ